MKTLIIYPSVKTPKFINDLGECIKAPNDSLIRRGKTFVLDRINIAYYEFSNEKLYNDVSYPSIEFVAYNHDIFTDEQIDWILDLSDIDFISLVTVRIHALSHSNEERKLIMEGVRRICRINKIPLLELKKIPTIEDKVLERAFELLSK